MTRSLVLAVLLCLCAVSAPAQWQVLAPGIEYQEFALTDPNDAYVARMDMDAAGATLDSMLANRSLGGTRQTVSGMVASHDGDVSYWGQQWGAYTYEIKVAVNGDFWDTTNNVPQSGHIMNGWYAKRFTDFSGGSGLAWTLNRGVFLGGCVYHSASRQKAIYPRTSEDQNINGINRARASGELVVYTPQYGARTPVVAGVEVLVRLARPMLILPSPSYAQGTVLSVNNAGTGTYIPFDCVVLSGSGSAGTKLQQNLVAGDEVRITQEITHYNSDCLTARPFDWTKTFSAIGGNFIFLENGIIDPHTNNAGATNRNPRTALAYDTDYLYVIVVDGRRAGSIGMTMQELGEFCRDTLGATHGINLDGGGSSAMWVDQGATGGIVNVPSDGSERATYNGLMVVALVPRQDSTVYTVGDSPLLKSGSGPVRLGPGSQQFTYISTYPDTEVEIISHPLNGIIVRGKAWWHIELPDGRQGWASEDQLENLSAARGDAWIL